MDIGPNPSHQVLLADELTAPLKQNGQDFQRPASDPYGLIAFQQKKLRRKQAKRSERNVGWSDAGRCRLLLEDRSDHMSTLNGVSDIEARFGVKLLQASES
ncbi:hypothetical protein [Bradyrhizobium commune]|uniref:hypothetical protein n=1 Tax=Bradyrhizobium commune TaxID=83627 RepID=UPI001FEFEDE8|nr:hypothetical protein [Bradyrhizobium commune]